MRGAHECASLGLARIQRGRCGRLAGVHLDCSVASGQDALRRDAADAVDVLELLARDGGEICEGAMSGVLGTQGEVLALSVDNDGLL